MPATGSTSALLDRLVAALRPGQQLAGVAGNNDGPPRRRRLPEVAEAVLGVLRADGRARDRAGCRARERRCAARFPDTDVLVFGHGHVPWDSTAPGGLRLLNPGSPTDRRRQPHHTWMTASVSRVRLTRVRLHRLGEERAGS